MKKSALFFFFLFVFHNAVSQKSNYNVSLIPEELKENVNSCIRLQSVMVEIKSYKKYKITTQKVITVFNKYGMSNIDAREYFDNSTNVNSIEAIIYNATGSIVNKVKKSDFKNESVTDGLTISDNRVLYLEYVPIEFPFTVVYNSEVESSNTAFLPKWQPIDDYFESVEKSIFSVIYPPDVGFKFKEYNFEEKDIKTTKSSTNIRFEIENVVAEKPEYGSSTFKNIVPKVLFSLEKFSLEGVEGSATTWHDFGLWMNNKLLVNADELSIDTQSMVKNLVSEEKDIFKKAKIIYNYVQNKTRYVSIQMGIGGWKPMPAKDVDRLGYGDCKALSNYTKALLKVVGIPSYYTIIFGGSSRQDIDEDFVSMQGNHAILTLPIGNQLYFLECTSQTIPFAFEGDFTDDRKALAVTPEGGKIIATQLFSDGASTQISKGSYSISESGAVLCNVEICSKGLQYDAVSNLDTKSAIEIEKYYKSYFNWIQNLLIAKPTFINNKDSIEFRSTLHFSADGYGQVISDLLIFQINLFNQDNLIPQRYRNRKNYFEIERAYKDIDEIEITIPDGYKIESMPNNLSISEKFGDYSIEIKSLSQTKIVYRRVSIIKKGSWNKTEYENYRNFKEQIFKADNCKIALKKN